MLILATNILRILFISILVLPLFTFAQTEPTLPPPPVFLQGIKSQADFNNLTTEQKAEVKEYVRENPRFLFSGANPSTSSVSLKEPVQSTGVVNCFDYYHFGSVQVDLSATMAQTVPGATMTFAGKIKNDNSYPIVDGGVFVKIFKVTDKADEVIKKDGQPLVAQFALPEQFNLPANSETDATFDWIVPANAEDGEYFAAFYFQSAKRYNLLGLSFTDDVTGNQAHFSITNPGQTNLVAFDKSAVTLNDIPHAFAAFPQHFTKDEPVKAKVTLVNPRAEAVVVSLNWKLHDWDSLRPDSVMDSKTEIVELKAGESQTFEYIAEPTGTAVSYLVVEMKDGYSSSLLNIRFVRDDVLETRINFPSITSFPLVAGQETAVFSCVHSTNLPVVSDNVLDLVLSDKAGNVIHSYQYQGDITGAMMGMVDTFVPSESYDYLSLKATLSRHGQVIEEVTQVYDCTEIDNNLCLKPEPVTGGVGDFLKQIGIILLIVILLAGLGVSLHRKFKKQPETIVGLFLAVAVGLSFGANQVEAKSVTWSSGGIPSLANFWNYSGFGGNPIDADINTASCAYGCGWASNLSGVQAFVTYKAQVVNVDTGAVVPEGSILPVGTRIKVQDIPKVNTDISWFGTGRSGDSPYGRWVSNANPVPLSCDPSDYVGTYSYTGMFGLETNHTYNRLNVHPTTPVFSSASGNISCDASGICTVTGAGAISLGMTFPATYGKFYHQYHHIDVLFNYCGGNYIPMRAQNLTGTIKFEGGVFACYTRYCNPGSDYILNVPAQTISFSFTGNNPNNPPTAPILSGPATGYTGQSLSFTANGTDPDVGDLVRYLFDWNNDGIGDQWSGGFVPSGTNQSLSHAWVADGTYTLKVATQDNKGTYSGWSLPFNVTINTTGQCGVANGAALAASPTIGLCLSGTASVVTGVSHGPYTWDCLGSSGGPSQSCATVAVAPTVSFSANPTTVDLGNQSKLTWTVDGATSCVGSTGGPSWDIAQPHTGTNFQFVTPLTTTVYRLTCTGAGGPTLKTATVSINAPTISFTANPSLIGPGNSSNLQWTVSGATSCTASGGWGGAKGFSGTNNESVSPLVTTTYGLECTGPGGTTTATPITVTLPSGNITATTCTIPSGSTSCNSTVGWNSANFLGTASILQGTSLISTSPSNLGSLYAVDPTNQTFTLKDTGSSFVDTAIASINCAAGSVWAWGMCTPLPVISISSTPNTVRRNETATLNISILANYDLSCTLYGAATPSFNHNASSVTKNYTYSTNPLTSAQVVRIECTAPTFPVVNGSAETRVNLIPDVEEI